jgi:ABC-type hemin transport system substrate-binding protein
MTAETYADRGYNSPEHETLDGILNALNRIADNLDAKNKGTTVKTHMSSLPNVEDIRAALAHNPKAFVA